MSLEEIVSLSIRARINYYDTKVNKTINSPFATYTFRYDDKTEVFIPESISYETFDERGTYLYIDIINKTVLEKKENPYMLLASYLTSFLNEEKKFIEANYKKNPTLRIITLAGKINQFSTNNNHFKNFIPDEERSLIEGMILFYKKKEEETKRIEGKTKKTDEDVKDTYILGLEGKISLKPGEHYSEGIFYFELKEEKSKERSNIIITPLDYQEQFKQENNSENFSITIPYKTIIQQNILLKTIFEGLKNYIEKKYESIESIIKRKNRLNGLLSDDFKDQEHLTLRQIYFGRVKKITEVKKHTTD